MSSDPTTTLEQITDAVVLARHAIDQATQAARSRGPAIEDNQSFMYDLAHAAAAVTMAEVALNYATRGPNELRLAAIFGGRIVGELAATLWRSGDQWGVQAAVLEPARAFVAAAGHPDYVAAAASAPGDAHLGDDLGLVAETFRRFGQDRILPHAESIHRNDTDIPDEIIDGVCELGCFGLSIPTQYGGSAEGTEDDYMAMVIATEELSRASLGAGGSLITRPEILARALEAGGTEAQKQRWLPRIASGDALCAVAVTEPDHGSDVAALKVTARPVDGGYVLNGTKTWCTFAGRANVLMVLARTNPDPDVRHRGLSIFIVEKPADTGRAFRHEQGGGTLEGRAIPTLGYRGMHSFEVVFDNWFVPAENLIGEADGLGRGFYLQMTGFENGRLQTAARALGVMQRAYELGADYASQRRVFGAPLDSYQLTRVTLGHIAATIQIGRQFTYHVARLMARGDGALEAAMAKAAICRWAEQTTRDCMQLHGGYGYAEEYEISRLFVDARVLSIFEGADETLCLKLIARRLVA